MDLPSFFNLAALRRIFPFGSFLSVVDSGFQELFVRERRVAGSPGFRVVRCKSRRWLRRLLAATGGIHRDTRAGGGGFQMAVAAGDRKPLEPFHQEPRLRAALKWSIAARAKGTLARVPACFFF
jgi:hypothetical protein